VSLIAITVVVVWIAVRVFPWQRHRTWMSRFFVITGAKVSMTITASSSSVASGQTCYVMSGTLTGQKVIQTDQSVVTTSGPVGIFYCNPQCYAEFFEPTTKFPGGSVYLEKVTRNCPTGFNSSGVQTLAAYAGPNIGKRGPASG
jgi:hypothetical protein